MENVIVLVVLTFEEETIEHDDYMDEGCRAMDALLRYYANTITPEEYNELFGSSNK